MKRGTLILVLAIALVGLTGQTWAAETDTITVTVSMESVVSVSVSPDAWNIGAVSEGGASGAESFTATNDGNVTEDLTITGANGANGWNIGAAAGVDVFAVMLDRSLPSEDMLETGPVPLTDALAPAAGHAFTLDYLAPTSDTQGGGVDHSFSITITASATP
jgi:hypothetical protein